MAEGSRESSDAVRISVEEAAVLQGFRADYPWQGSRSRRFIQIGNAVCPPLARLVVAALVRQSPGPRGGAR
jgi:DNA (cytosine-5)-methyltransferase 1